MDILLLILLAVGFISGLFSGAVKQVVSLVAFVAGFILACLYYQELGDVLEGFLNYPTFCKVAAFVLLCVVVPIVASLIASLITKMLNFIPVLGTLNRLLGGLLCMAKYALVLGAFIWFFSSADLIKKETMQKSVLCGPLKAIPEFVYKSLTAHTRSNNTSQRHNESDAPDASCDTIPNVGNGGSEQ